MIIRYAQKDDAKKFWNLMKALDQETTYMMYEPDEREEDLRMPQRVIDAAVEDGNLLAFAEEGEELVGFLSAVRERNRRNRHCAYLVCGVRKQYWNRGIAKMFFRILDDWAEEKGVKRVELIVRKDNYVARHVYERHGFAYEGEHKMAMLIDGEYYSEVHMAKIYE